MQVNNAGIARSIVDKDVLAALVLGMVSFESMIFFHCQKIRKRVSGLECNFDKEWLDCNFRIRHYLVITFSDHCS